LLYQHVSMLIFYTYVQILYNTFATASITYIYKCNRWINFINIVYINSTYENLYNFLVYTEKKLVNFNKYLIEYYQLNVY